MVHKRTLPEARNPLLLPEHTPQLDILAERRRLGQTNLHLKTGQVGTTNAAKPENLGLFDYAHLRAPLPKDLQGSGVFSLQKNGAYPESYFLMRRSSDGYISATGMFKAAYPWATLAQEEAERNHHKTLPTAGDEEVAGNVWISPEDALSLAEEYGMKAWVVALLDPAPIEKGAKDKGSAANDIATPPRFVVPDKGSLFPPATGSMRTRSRELRSASPSKTAAPRKMASPRKPRTTRKTAKAADAEAATPAGSTSKLAKEVEDGTPAPTDATESVNGDAAAEKGLTPVPEKVQVEVDESVRTDGDVETTTTTVKVDVPAEHPELAIPEDPQEMIARAREMVEAANKAEGRGDDAKAATKRKADDVEMDDAEGAGLEMQQPAKKTKVLQEELKKEKVRTRAFMGLSATLAIGAMIPFFQSLL
ncbi:uncharacterized protein K452DRAFT_296758 [Aplosporella prunicola CBS 121167]|uniref:HTH APSES-type domain-containing protein n=1 Tax=Aplosporella prunicola CBS 121167 TaxID=1176127 RepID=A0A6A6BKD2_9PEZI|nr:uncharacterized protein K452DRAFT_296758 [Aplosporella prunicola CBS 121167]KAF2143775.1 hypothetical protein K452DRAFT_296758 [Aplosporella prunicola CBS 121167]